jgi:DNA-binding GntR family transcriptional regulator
MVATIAEHWAVIEAIRAGDAERAGRAMRDHVNLLGDDLTDFIASLPPDISTLATSR